MKPTLATQVGRVSSVLILVISLGVASILFRAFTTESYRSPTAIELSRIRSLGITLREYADEHEGHFPEKISDLPNAGTIPVAGDSTPLGVAQFHDPETQKSYDWLYYPDHTLAEARQTSHSGYTLDHAPKTILAASPRVVTNGSRVEKRIVLYLDGSCEIAQESDFQELISQNNLQK